MIKVDLATMVRRPDPHDVAAALHRSVALFLRRLRRVPATSGELTVPEMSALAHLELLGSATSAELAKIENISPQGMGTTVGGLEQRGFVERQRDPADGRRAVLFLTGAGEQAVLDKRGVRTEQLAQALAAEFTPSELDTLLAAAALIERLGERF